MNCNWPLTIGIFQKTTVVTFVAVLLSFLSQCLSKLRPDSGVHGSNITTSVDSNSSSTKPQDCQKVTLEANKDADKDKVDEMLLCVSDSLFHRLKPNEVFIKNNKTVKLVKSGDTAAGVIERTCDYVRNAQATSFTGY